MKGKSIRPGIYLGMALIVTTAMVGCVVPTWTKSAAAKYRIHGTP